MNDIIAKFVVYYRELPQAIETIILMDGKMSLVKDGIKITANGKKSPRITINIEEKKSTDKKTRIDKITYVLSELESNNQILGFKKVS